MAGVDNNNQNIPDRLRQLERKLDALIKGAPLRNASITEGGIRVGGDGYIRSTNWDGTSIDDPGTMGWALGGADGVAILNTLLLREGIIGNDALTSPLGWAWEQRTEMGFAISTSGELRGQADLVIPAGFTKVAAIVAVGAGAVNSRASSDFLYAEAMLNGTVASEMPTLATSGTWGDVYSVRVGVVEGLSGVEGQSVPIAARVHAQNGGWAANSTNRVHVAALGLCFR